jgi:hypothetical protein
MLADMPAVNALSAVLIAPWTIGGNFQRQWLSDISAADYGTNR